MQLGTATVRDVPGGTPEDPARRRLEELFAANSRKLLGYALRRTETPEDAADVVSQVMLIAWRRLDDVPEGEESALWLYGVAHRVIANDARASRRRTRLGARLRQEVSALATARPVDDDAAIIREAVKRLPRADREVLLLFAWEGLTPAEIARVLALTPSSARSRLHRARTRLRKELER